MIEASLDGLITVDPLLIITDVNEQMCRMSGYPREELIGTPFPHYFSEPTRASEGVRLTLDRGAVTNYELNLRAKDGHDSLVSFNAAIFKDQAGAVRGIFASARDITEQARLQAQLAEERAYNRGLIEASVDGLVTVDESMTITDVNETLCRMVGRQRNQLIGSAVRELLHRARAAPRKGYGSPFTEGAVTNYVLTLQAADGHLVPVSFNAAVFKDTAGRVRGIFASARDITAQKQLEVAAPGLADLHPLVDRIQHRRADDHRPAGHHHRRQPADGGAHRLDARGADRHAVQGLLHRPGAGRGRHPTGAARGQGHQLRAHRPQRKRPRDVVSYNAATFYDRDGKLQGVFAAARDITEQKQLEEQLREQQIYLRGLIESSVDGLVTVDPSDTITDVNERCAR